jgi:membrane protease YdiL (CAAX protease family)
MKSLLGILCASSFLYSQEAANVILETPPIEETFSQEIAAYDPTLVQQPISPMEQHPPLVAPSHKSPFLAAGLSSLFPGFGHLYLGDVKTAGALIGSAGAGVGAAFLGYRNEQILGTSLLTVSAVYSYGIYAAYRDARKINGTASYTYQMPTDSFADLALAPFRLSVLKKPEVWGAFLGVLTIAAGTAYFAYPGEAHAALSIRTELLAPLAAFPVAIGEESLFRGYLQSQLTELMNPWAGIALSSLAFGAAHIPNAQLLDKEERWRYYSFSIPLITAIGAYFGWMTHKNHSLKESVALHTWYDFTLFAAGALANQAAATGRPGFACAFVY